jgi:AmmeMemoRadiSam system protein B
MELTNLRPAALAGQWYRADPQQLEQEVRGYIEAVDVPKLKGRVIGLIAPHAGHIYSGPVAGHAFATVKGKQVDTVMVISPFHAGHTSPLMTTIHDGYTTPLGDIPVDKDNLARLEGRLSEQGGPMVAAVSRDREHAVEIELPFLQTTLSGDFKLLPLMHASLPLDETEALAVALADTLRGQKALLIASSDLSHFYSQETANKLDHTLLDAVASFDPKKVLEVHANGKGQACGLAAILTVMHATRMLGATRSDIIKYATSGNVSGDYQRVVGYASAAFTGN